MFNPLACLGVYMELQALQDAAGLGKWKGLERCRRVHVPVILHQPDVLGVGIDCISQVAQLLGIVGLGTPANIFVVPAFGPTRSQGLDMTGLLVAQAQ
jgi:hypothetical protein